MINNRQNGRRRGRGGGAPRPNGAGSGPDRGNRLDNRARGNAAQLHEKYKALARDAQMQGDRVNAEYYLQFADHYFRVLSENRARFEDQQQQRPRRDDYQGPSDYQQHADDQDDYDEADAAGNVVHANNGNGHFEERDRGDRHERFERQDYVERRPREERPERPQRAQRPEAVERGNDFEDQRPRRGRGPRRQESESWVDEAHGGDAAVSPVAEQSPAAEPAAERPRRGRRSRAEMEAAAAAAEERIEIDRLPPAFGADAPLLAGVVEPAPAVEEKPRRRTRRPRSDAVATEA